LARQPDFAALLALESYRTSPTVDALGALLNVVDTSTTFVQRVDAHEDPIDAVARSADGRLAASGDRSGGVVIWEVADDGVVERRSDLDVDSAVLDLTLDGSGLLTILSDGQPAQVWDVSAVPSVLVEEGVVAGYAASSPDGLTAAGLAPADDGDTLFVIGDPLAAEPDLALPLGVPYDDLEGVTMPTFSPDGSLVAVGVDTEVLLVRDDEFEVLDLLDLEGIEAADGLALSSLEFVSDDGVIALGVEEGHIYLVDVFGDAIAHPLTPLTSSGPRSMAAITAVEDGETFELLGSAHDNGEVKVWIIDGLDGSEFQTLRGHTEEGLAVTLSPEGLVFSGDWDGDLVVSDAFGLAQIGFPLVSEELLPVHQSDVEDVAFLTPSTIVSLDAAGELQSWSTDTLLPDGIVTGSAITAVDARLGFVATGDEEGGVAISGADGARVDAGPTHPATVELVEISGDGSRFVTASSAGDAWVWTTDGERIVEIDLPDDFSVSAAVFPTAEELWLGGVEFREEDQQSLVLAVDPSSGTVTATARHNDEPGHDVASLAVSPDGSTLASGGTDRRIFLHDTAALDSDQK
jgi:WD40 repeat protein